jgi:hypothetical protein
VIRSERRRHPGVLGGEKALPGRAAAAEAAERAWRRRTRVVSASGTLFTVRAETQLFSVCAENNCFQCALKTAVFSVLAENKGADEAVELQPARLTLQRGGAGLEATR